MTKYEYLKLHKNSLYGKTVFEISKADAETLIAYIHENYCDNRDVATGNYDCPYATTVINTICCTGHECNYRGIYNKPSSVVNNTDTNTNYDLSLDDSDIVDYPF